jgi:hypothetical protein
METEGVGCVDCVGCLGHTGPGAKSENSVRLRKFEQNQTFIWIFGFIFFKTCKKVVLDGKKVVLNGKKVFCLQNKPLFGRRRDRPPENIQKNTKNRPKIGESLAFILVWTALGGTWGPKFNCVR